jgi:hypothetical protein
MHLNRLTPFHAALTILIVALVSGVAGQQPATADDRVISFGTQGAGDGQLNSPLGVTVAPNGRVYVADYNNSRIQVFTADGAYLDQWPTDHPTALASDASGIYVIPDDGSNAIAKYSLDGDPLWRTPQNVFGSAPLSSVAVQGSTLYVAFIEYYDTKVGRLATTDGSPFAPVWTFTYEFSGAIAPAPGGDVFIGGQNLIKRLDSEGRVVSQVTGMNFFWALASDSSGGLFLSPGHAWNDVSSVFLDYLPPGSSQAVEIFPEVNRRFGRMALSADGRYLYAVTHCSTVGECSNASAVYRFEVGGPIVSLSADDVEPVTGQAVTFTATGSVPVGRIERYEWDLDGNGTYETSGSGSSIVTSFADPGSHSVRVRVDSSLGGSAVSDRAVQVFPAPPNAEPGVSINDGSPYTNRKGVVLNLSWPARATEARISNDGGFAPSRTTTVSVAPNQPWTLDDSVSGKYTKVVYVRFGGSGIDRSKTYSDDIMLDTSPPEITSASASSGDAKAAGLTGTVVSKANKSIVLVKVKARDRLTGVRKLQVNSVARSRTPRDAVCAVGGSAGSR